MSMPDPIARLNAALEGRYRIEREVGEGGMAIVYLAADLRHERNVAIKVLKPEWHAHSGGWAPDSKNVVYSRDRDFGDIYVIEPRR